MKRIGTFCALAALAAFTATGATAQDAYYKDPEACVAAVAALDTNGDGYVDVSEVREGDIEAAVDTDRDRRISKEEAAIACQARVMRVIKPGGQ